MCNEIKYSKLLVNKNWIASSAAFANAAEGK